MKSNLRCIEEADHKAREIAEKFFSRFLHSRLGKKQGSQDNSIVIVDKITHI